jgi:hypothetical protein
MLIGEIDVHPLANGTFRASPVPFRCAVLRYVVRQASALLETVLARDSSCATLRGVGERRQEDLWRLTIALCWTSFCVPVRKR